MDLMIVNEDANYLVELFADNKWQPLTQEYSVSAATITMTNACIISKLKGRVLSKRSNNMLLAKY